MIKKFEQYHELDPYGEDDWNDVKSIIEQIDDELTKELESFNMLLKKECMPFIGGKKIIIITDIERGGELYLMNICNYEVNINGHEGDFIEIAEKIDYDKSKVTVEKFNILGDSVVENVVNYVTSCVSEWFDEYFIKNIYKVENEKI